MTMLKSARALGIVCFFRHRGEPWEGKLQEGSDEQLAIKFSTQMVDCFEKQVNIPVPLLQWLRSMEILRLQGCCLPATTLM